MDLIGIAQLIVSGLTIGAVYAIVALGFVTIFKSSSIINFAQGEFVMLGGMLTIVFFKGLHLPYLISAALAVACVTIIGFVVYLLAIHPLRRAPVLILVMATLGVSMFIANTTMLLLGNTPKSMPPISVGGSLMVGGVAFSSQSIWMFSLCVAILICLYLLANYTLIGKAMEASSTAPLGADLVGIPRNRMVLYSFGVSAAIGAVGGILISPIFFVRFDSGSMLGLKGFVAAVIGGWGSAAGAVVGGLLVGVLESLSIGFISAGYKNAIAFLAMILILYLKPNGLLGSEEVVKY